MRVILHVLLVAACVNTEVSSLKNPDVVRRLRHPIKESGNMTKKLVDRIEQNSKSMSNFWRSSSRCSETLKERTTLSPEQKEYLEKRSCKQKMRKTPWMKGSIEDVNVKSGIADELFQGDMLLSKEQLKEIVTDSVSRQKRQAPNDNTYPGKRWIHVVNYTLDRNLDEIAKEAFKNATYLWMNDTCIDFMEDTTEESTDMILVYKHNGCWAEVGRHEGWQLISLGEGCDTVGTAAHEIGHALGFTHTHARYDRDEFITVIKENINCSWLGQFEAKTMDTNNNYNLTYDYGSIMQYRASSFANGSGKFTMIPKDVMYTETLGSPIISFYDLLMMNMYYNCTGACKDDADADEKCKNGGFAHPRNCSKCICPSGYGGQFCDERPPGCGALLNASNDWQTLTDPLNATEADKDGYTRCNYWIKAPDNKTVEVNIVEVQVAQFYSEGCVEGGVEIKTHTDQRRTGYRFCTANAVNTTLKSNSSMVPVITFKLEGSGESKGELFGQMDDEEDENGEDNGSEDESDYEYDEEEFYPVVKLKYRYV